MTTFWTCRVRCVLHLVDQTASVLPDNICWYLFVFLEYWDLMNEDEKYDKIPEVWEGHNIADYIDPDIMKVGRLRHVAHAASGISRGCNLVCFLLTETGGAGEGGGAEGARWRVRLGRGERR